MNDQDLTIPELKKISKMLDEEAIKKAYKEPEISVKKIKTKIEEIICISEAEKRFKKFHSKPFLNFGDYIDLELVLREGLDKFKLKFLRYYKLKSIARKIESNLNSVFSEFDYVIVAGE